MGAFIEDQRGGSTEGPHLLGELLEVRGKDDAPCGAGPVVDVQSGVVLREPGAEPNNSI